MENKSIKKNMVMSILLTASNFIFPLITYSYVARTLTPTGTGKIAFVNSILTYFSFIAMLGIPTYGLRECAKVRDNNEAFSHTVQELVIINLISTVFAYILLFSAVFFVPKLFEYRAVFAVMSIYIFLNSIGLEWVYKALEEYTYITIRSLIFKCISVVLVFLLIKSPDDYLYYGFLTIFTNSASYICNFINVRKYVSFKKTSQYELKKHLKPIFMLFATSIIITIYSNFDVSMIGFISTEREVGLYNAALKIKSILLSLSTAVTSVMIPRMAYYFRDEKTNQVNSLLEKSMRVSLIIALPFAVYVFVYAEKCLSFLCGNEYLAAGSTLRVLMLCIVPLIITNILGNQILIPSGNEKRYSQSVFIGMWINLVLNLLLIPYLGAFGAAIGTLITECFNVVWMGMGSEKYIKVLLNNIKYYKYFTPLIIGTIISLLLFKNISALNVFWQLVYTSIVVFGIYYVGLIVQKEPLIEQTLNKIKIRRNKDCM